MSDTKDIQRGVRKEFTGQVISDKMQKTIVVEITRQVRHGQYQKTVRTKARFKAHDEKNEAHTGDTVRIVETRPYSRDKRWRLDEIIARARVVKEAAGDI